MARALDISFSPGLLGVKWEVLSPGTSSLGGGCANRGIVDIAGRWNRSVHPGSVFEPEEPFGLCLRVRRHAHSGTEISCGWSVVDIRTQRSPTDADVHHFLLPSVGGDETF